MRLLTVSHYYEIHGGGIERVAAQLCRQWASDGNSVAWAASDADASPGSAIEAVPLRCANPTEAWLGLPMPIPGPRALRDLSRAIRDCDAVFIHDSLYLTSVMAMALARMRGKPVVLIQHIAGIDFANALLRGVMRLANRLVTRPMLGAANGLVFISDRVRRDLLGEPARRDFALLFNGVDAEIFHPGNVSARRAVRASFGLPVDARIATFVGRFVAKKGMTVLQALARRRRDLHFALAGSGPMRPDEWGLPNVHNLGSLPQHVIADLYCASDLLVLPSVGEGYPLVIQEAMACGLPVVCGKEAACADPGAARWLRGVDIDLADPEQSAFRCSTTINNVFDDPPDCAAMAAYAAKAYSWPAMARGIVQSLSRRSQTADCTAGRYQPG